jgi:hypothetical protein
VASALELTVRAHPANAWMLCTLARPALVIDGAAHPVRWRETARIEVEAGKRNIAVGYRLFGLPWLLGARERAYVVPEEGTLGLSAMNGPLVTEPFNVEISRRATSA